ncbi:MAG: hypothetical protein GF350_04075 [Chitinivibrionales bacterium]|nr:hypothetical protein [Chitinivibrionales bacterium]
MLSPGHPQIPQDQPKPRLITIADPAPGAELSSGPPAGHRLKIISIQFSMTASAAVANRTIDLLISQAGVDFLRFDFTIVHTAALTYTYHLVPGMQQAAFTIGFDRFVPAPSDVYLFFGQTIQTDTVNLQAGDQFNNISIYAFAWPDFVNVAPY